MCFTVRQLKSQDFTLDCAYTYRKGCVQQQQSRVLYHGHIFQSHICYFQITKRKNPERMKRTVNVRAHVWSALDLSPKKCLV